MKTFLYFFENIFTINPSNFNAAVLGEKAKKGTIPAAKKKKKKNGQRKLPKKM